jgi:hypothetical protein
MQRPSTPDSRICALLSSTALATILAVGTLANAQSVAPTAKPAAKMIRA